MPERHHGAIAKAPELTRRNHIGVYFTDAELADLAALAGVEVPVKMKGGEQLARKKIARFLRDSAIGKVSPVAPEINQEAWQKIGPALNNLNQIAHRLNKLLPFSEADLQDVLELTAALKKVRGKLL